MSKLKHASQFFVVDSPRNKGDKRLYPNYKNLKDIIVKDDDPDMDEMDKTEKEEDEKGW